jgi:predicted MPP superfamily phosphohydrolase
MNFKEFIYDAMGMLYIPPELLEISGKKLLHISDTPIGFYSQLKRLIGRLKPDYIVHTGDMTDNIKLELYPTSIYEHEKWIKKLAAILEPSGAQVILALGNHDNPQVVSRYFINSRIVEKVETIDIEGLSFRISHYSDCVLEEPAEYNLFGHDLKIKNGRIGNKLYFNGISYINIIGLETGEKAVIKYPAGTDDARLGRRKIGL